jgi:hypothetical protein
MTRIMRVVGCLLLLAATSKMAPIAAAQTNGVRYGFEEQPLTWKRQYQGDSAGVASVARSTDQARTGSFSLKLLMDLDGDDLKKRSKGEVFVEIEQQNLEGKEISVWVYVPDWEAIGDPSKPNGIQVFAKDVNWNGEYGTWWNIEGEDIGKWRKYILIPSKQEPEGGYMAEGFDPTQIRSIGLKIGVGGGSKAKYGGAIYIDDVDWPGEPKEKLSR